MRKGLYAAGLLAAVLWLLAAAAGLVWLSAGDGGLMAREMLKHAPPEASGLPEAEYRGAAEMTAGYLTGRTAEFQYLLTGEDGVTYACFQPHEAAHMADCRALILLAGRVCLLWLAALALIIVFLLTGRRVRTPEEKRRLGKGVLTGLGIVLSAVIVLGAWAIEDFDGFFTAFHRIAFTNDGWLLNPRTDLLIRLMPTSFFVALGVRGARLFMPAPGLAAGAAAALIRAGNGMKRKEKTADEL